MPIARAASTNGISRIAKVLERMTRAALGMRGIEIARITFSTDGPRAADITRAITSRGSPCMMSMMRWAIMSHQPIR